MLIRSQDKKSLFNMDVMANLQINKKFGDSRATYRVVIYFTEDDIATIGEYSTEEKTIKVLDMIVDNYINLTAYKANDPYRKGCDSVFQIPQESEVSDE